MILTTTTSLVQRYLHVRNTTVALCAPLLPEDHVPQPITDVSPPKWHLGHTTWFFENFILSREVPNYSCYKQEWNFVFNSYYESQGPRVNRSHRGNLTRPSLQQVHDYRQHVDKHMEAYLAKVELTDELAYVIELGLQHEQQHQELLVTDFKYILGHNPLFPAYHSGEASLSGKQAQPVKWLPIDEGVYEIGADEGEAFHIRQRNR